MDDVKQTADFYRLVAWAHARRKQLISIAVAVVAVAATIGLYNWHKNYNETQAAEAFSKIKLPMDAASVTPAAADPYIKLAADYEGTTAAARALLTAGGILFDTGKFKDAQQQFEKVLQTYAEFPLADQASVGVAASLEAQGKLADAESRYEDFIRRHPLSAAIPQARSALARIDIAQNKPERALEQYNEMMRSGSQDNWSAEAGMQAQELLQKYPQLRKSMTPSPSTLPPGAAAPKLFTQPKSATPPATTAPAKSSPPALLNVNTNK